MLGRLVESPRPLEGRVPAPPAPPTAACSRRPFRRSAACPRSAGPRRPRPRPSLRSRPRGRAIARISGTRARTRRRKLRRAVRGARAAPRLPGVAGAARALARELRRATGAGALAATGPPGSLALSAARPLPLALPALELVLDAVVDVDVTAVDVAVEIDVADVAPVDVVPDLVVRPAHRPGRRCAEERAAGPDGADSPGVVVPGVRTGVVADDRQGRGQNDDLGRVLGHVDDLRVRALDRDDLVLGAHGLLVVGHQVARRLHLAAEALDRIHHLARIRCDLFAEADRPVEAGRHHPDDVGGVQQVAHALVPGRIGLERLVLREAVEEAVRLDDVEGVGRRGEDDRQQGIGIERDRGHQLVDRGIRRDRERSCGRGRLRRRRRRALLRALARTAQRDREGQYEPPDLPSRSRLPQGTSSREPVMGVCQIRNQRGPP